MCAKVALEVNRAIASTNAGEVVTHPTDGRTSIVATDDPVRLEIAPVACIRVRLIDERLAVAMIRGIVRTRGHYVSAGTVAAG